MTFNLLNYAKAEIDLAKQALNKRPDDFLQKKRLVYWLAKTGEIEEATKISGINEELLGIVAIFNG